MMNLLAMIGLRVRFRNRHPWAGHEGEIVRVEMTPFGERFVVRLDNGDEVPQGHECFIMDNADAEILR